jgi:hypothetical protein
MFNQQGQGFFAPNPQGFFGQQARPGQGLFGPNPQGFFGQQARPGQGVQRLLAQQQQPQQQQPQQQQHICPICHLGILSTDKFIHSPSAKTYYHQSCYVNLGGQDVKGVRPITAESRGPCGNCGRNVYADQPRVKSPQNDRYYHALCSFVVGMYDDEMLYRFKNEYNLRIPNRIRQEIRIKNARFARAIDTVYGIGDGGGGGLVPQGRPQARAQGLPRAQQQQQQQQRAHPQNCVEYNTEQLQILGNPSQENRFSNILDNTDKPDYWALLKKERILINSDIPAKIKGYVDQIRSQMWKKINKTISSNDFKVWQGQAGYIAGGAHKQVYDMSRIQGQERADVVVKVDFAPYQTPYIINNQTPDIINTFCKNPRAGWSSDRGGGKHCHYSGIPIKSVSFIDNWNPAKRYDVCRVACNNIIIENYLDLLTDRKYLREAISPCFVRTYLSTVNNKEDRISGNYSLVIQEKIKGDIIFNLGNLEIVGYRKCLMHVLLTLHTLQARNRLSQNDIQSRNVFVVDSNSNKQCWGYDTNNNDNNSKSCKLLREVDLFHYKFRQEDGTLKDYFIEKDSFLGIISDFGWSEAVTDTGEYLFCLNQKNINRVGEGCYSEDGENWLLWGNNHPDPETRRQFKESPYAWYNDIMYFLTNSLWWYLSEHSGRRTFERTNNYGFSTENPKGARKTVKQILGEITAYIKAGIENNPQKSCITMNIILLITILRNRPSIQSTIDMIRQNPDNDFLYKKLNKYWGIYFFPNAEEGSFPFDKWVRDVPVRRNLKLNYKNYDTADWTMSKNRDITILNFTNSVFEYFSRIPGSGITTQKPERIPDNKILRLRYFGNPNPRYTQVNEPLLNEIIDSINGSATTPNVPVIQVNGSQAYQPTYIKALNNNDVEKACGFYFAFENIIFPSKNPNLRIVDQADRKAKRVNNEQGKEMLRQNKQFVHVTMFLDPSKVVGDRQGRCSNESIDVRTTRQLLSETLDRVLGPNNLDPNKFGFASSGAFFKMFSSPPGEAPSETKHCDKLNPRQQQEVGCFRPVGFVYKNGRVIPHEPMPAEYADVYGSVCRQGNGSISIESTPLTEQTLGNCSQVITAAPKLITNGEVVFGDDKLNQNRFTYNSRRLGGTQDYGPDFQRPPDPTRRERIGDINYDPRRYIQGNKMHRISGWLSHANGASNPRNAIGTDADGNIYFVYVEGRNFRGTGADMPTLARIMQSIGCTNALNLDGGGTALNMYKPQKSGCYIYTNPSWPINFSTKNSTSLTVLRGGSKKTIKKKYKFLKKKGTRKRKIYK